MAKTVKILLVIFLLFSILATFFIITFQFPFDIMAVKNDTYYVTASNGERFKVLYRLYNFPDESYSLDICDKFNNKTYLFGGDGCGTKDVNIEYLLTDNDIDYYKANIEYWRIDKMHKEIIFAHSKSRNLDIMGNASHIESYVHSVMVENDQTEKTYEIFAPVAKHELLVNDNADYVIAYAEKMILENENNVLDKLKYYVDNTDAIECTEYTKEEIIAKCLELLDRYLVKE